MAFEISTANRQHRSMGVRRVQGFLLLRLFCGLRQSNKLRALLHPLQPLQDAQLSKSAQPFVAHVVAAFIAQGVAFSGCHGWVVQLLGLQALQMCNVGQINGSTRTLLQRDEVVNLGQRHRDASDVEVHGAFAHALRVNGRKEQYIQCDP